MDAVEWTLLSEYPFVSEIGARRFMTNLRIEMRSHFGKHPDPKKDYLEFKVSEIGGKFYISYKML